MVTVLTMALVAILILEHRVKTRSKITFVVSIDGNAPTILKGNSMSATIDNIITCTVNVKDKGGNPVGALATTPTWTLDNQALATITPAADGLTAVVTPVGPVGTVNVTATVGTLTGSLAVALGAGAPATVTVTAVVA